jgi:NAD(P)-dependent dehydrogenase (short-subunit alcohol dehydrogenase family)
MNVVITGTSKGIGLEFTRQLVSQGHQVLAIARHPEQSPGLQELQKNHQNLLILSLDITDDKAPATIFRALKHWSSLDLLINNAGIYKDDDSWESFQASFKTNAVAPYLLTQALIPLLKEAPQAMVINISSVMGSITENKSGGAAAYRCSKAALNMLNKNLALQYSWLISVVVHPGWVQTQMGGSGANLSPQDSVQNILDQISKLQPAASGSFIDYSGQLRSW